MKKKIFSTLFALVLVCSFSLIPAMPVAAEGTPPTFTFSGSSLTADLGPWGGTGYVYPPTFDVTASGGIDITFYDVDGSLLENDNGTTPWYEALKGVGMPGLTAGTSITSIDPDNNSVFWVMVNLNTSIDHDWNGNPVSTLGPDGTCFTSDDTRHWGFQDWYRPATGKIAGAGEDPHYNPESYVTPNDRFPTANPHDASFYNTFDLRIKITHTGDNNYNYEMWVRMHNCASVVEGCPYCTCGVFNHAINNCGEDDAWRQLASNDITIFSISDIDLSAVHPFVGLGNYPVPATHTLTWGNVVVTGTPTPQAEVWVDDDWTSYSYGDPAGGHIFGYDAFATIQDGIGAVGDGGTVNVAAGTYSPTSTILINKDALVLRGPQANVDPRPSYGSTRTAGSPSEAIIDGGPNSLGVIIAIDADNVVINGLEVKSGTEDMIKQNNLHSGTVVKYCIIHDGLGDEGVQLKQCTGGVLEYNYVFEIADKGDGLNIANTSSYGVIRCNEVASIHGENAAIYIYDAEHMEIIGNLVRDSGLGGNDGIKVGAKNGDDIALRDVLVKDNIIHGITQDGISVYMSGVTVEGNEIYNCGSENGAIYLAFAISDITIQNNSVYDNVLQTGKYADAAGILIGTAVDASTVTINFNNIYNNDPYGVTNHASSGIVDATNNWWGANDGPSASPGSGDKVSANVNFNPWLVIGISAEPVGIEANGTSTTIRADMTMNSDDEDTSASGHIPDGTQITFSTNKGSFSSLTVDKTTIGGKATATLTSSTTVETATVTASAPPHTAVATATTAVFFTKSGVTVEDSKSESASNETVNAKTEADTEVDVDGSATVTAAKYSSNPGTGFSGDIGKYIDVHIDSDEGVDEIVIKVYYTNPEIAGRVESSLRLHWWDGTSWVACSDSGVNTTDIAGPPAYSGYMWAKVRSDTVPTLTQLSGTAFGGHGGTLPSPPPPPTVTLESIAASPSSLTLGVGETEQLTITATYSDDSTDDVTAEASYESSDTSVTTVSDAGLITGVAEGSAAITVSYTKDEIEATDTVSVTVIVFTPWSYDADADGVIDKSEAIVAVVDYFDGFITKAQALEVIALYFAS